MPIPISPHAAVALAVFLAVSLLVGAVMAGAGGWRAMAGRYPRAPAAGLPEESYRFTSLRTTGGLVGTASYRSCVKVGVGTRGISLALWGPFSLFHPPLFIPWDAVETCRTIELYGTRATRLTVKHGGSLTVYGNAAAAISRICAQRGLTEALA